ncbi:MAG: transcription elongation factor GreA [Deltaproteobacteria bacterium]|nr:transcription elongation factor GreA [Deltaproteobacteria bacterium]
MERIPITKQGLDKIKAELIHLEGIERPRNIRAIEEARGHGDLSENAEYHAAKETQSFIEGKINELRAAIGRSEVLDIETGPTDRVVFGRTVLLYDVNTEEKVTYQLLGPYESDPEKGKISVTSPLGQALIGREAGEEVRVRTPGGIQEFEIVEIR